jgi:hypothetical protein
LEALDSEGNPVKATYDLMGRRESLETPDMGKKEFGYDQAGNLIWETDGVLGKDGKRIEYRAAQRCRPPNLPSGGNTIYRYLWGWEKFLPGIEPLGKIIVINQPLNVFLNVVGSRSFPFAHIRRKPNLYRVLVNIIHNIQKPAQICYRTFKKAVSPHMMWIFWLKQGHCRLFPRKNF